MGRVERARQLETASLERTARSRAYKAFIAARGTRGHFERLVAAGLHERDCERHRRARIAPAWGTRAQMQPGIRSRH